MNKMTKTTEIESRIGVIFKDKLLLEQSLTHRSYLNENTLTKEHNERLEYLGDAVIEFLVSKFLFSKYPDHQEGELTSFRSATVKTETLSQVATDLGLGEFIRMSRGEENTGGREKPYILANTFEALTGAIYLDRGIKEAEKFLKTHLFHLIETIVNKRLDIDPKTKFQEIAQELHKLTPTYEVIGETGPDHSKQFTMGVYIGREEYGRGIGASKQKAEEQAAIKALKRIRRESKA